MKPPVNQQPAFASSFPNTNGRTVLAPQSGIPDVGERKVLLPTDANNQQNVLMKATGPVNEGKIFLPQHTQAAQQAVALASPQQPALNPSGDAMVGVPDIAVNKWKAFLPTYRISLLRMSAVVQ
uniref:Uncharacterized protein n=1 Tax=Romanomermis culicivorax TaxID=13658 RepID=A0A915K812_ROMCU